MLSENEMFIVNHEIVSRTEDEGTFLFDPNTGRICYLNDTGIDIWKFCKKPVTLKQVINEICSEYPEMTRNQISSDCQKFFNDLMKFGFLSIGAEK